jgi:ribosomal protein RSM22 (predicted rRNA methylase)
MEAFNPRPWYRFSDQAIRLFQSLSHPQTRPLSTLPGSIARLSRLFTKDRSGLGARYLDDPDMAAGYAAYFLPVNFAKVQILLSEMPEGWANRDLSVLDVGSGPGTAALAVRDWLKTHETSRSTGLHITAIDHSKATLTEATRLWHTYEQQVGGGPDRLLTFVEPLEKSKWESSSTVTAHAPFDLIIAANSLNELFHDSVDYLDKRLRFVERLLSVLKPDGTLMVIEPALRLTARALHHIRDRLLEHGTCSIYSPCLHERGCPALVKAEDWCHEERPWVPPSWITALDADLGFIKDALKFSYLLLRKDGRTIVPRQPDVYRMVSELRVFKGEKRAWLCNERGRSEVGRLNRKVTSSNADFDACHRGALVHIENLVRKERGGMLSPLGRIEEDGVVKIVRGA